MAARATPTLVQGRMFPTSTTNFSTNVVKIRLHRKLKAGNLGAFAITWGSSADTITSVVDDKGNSWVGDTAVQDGGNGQSMQWWYKNNGTADTKEITVTFSAAETFISVLGVYEYDCVNTGGSPVAGGARRTTSGASITSGSFNTTERTLVLQAVFLDSWPSQTKPCTWTRDGGNGYKFLTADGCSFAASQYAIKEAGAINPALGLSFSATSAMSATIAFKIQADAGTARARFGAVRMSYQMFPGNINGAISDKTTWDYQVPAEGNLLLAGIQTKNNNTVVKITDTNGNIWLPCGTASKDPINDHVVEHWSAINRRPNEDLVVSIQWSSATGGTPSSSPTVYFRDIIGADTVNPIAQTANSNGTSGATSGNITGATLSAPAAGGAIYGFEQEDGQTVTSVTNSGATMSAPDVGQYATDGVEKDGGVLDDYTSDGSSYTVTWVYSQYEGATTINKHLDQLVSIRAAPTADPGLKSPLPMVHHPMHEPSGFPNEVKSSKAWW